VVGGDGTASATLTALWQAYKAKATPLPQIALLRGGSMNTVASSLGVKQGTPVALLERLLEQQRSPELQRTRTRPLLRMGEQRLGFLFGTGVWYGYLAETYRQGPPTFPVYVKVLGRVFASAAVNGETIQRITRPTRTALHFRHTNGHAQEEWPAQPYLCIAAGTVADVGFGFQPFHRAFAHDAAFQLLAISGSARELLFALPDLRRGRGLPASIARQTITSWVELEAEGGRIEYSIDGDIDTIEGTLRLSMGPSFEFLL
jgi:diacylglycerol kinase (ATP)